MRKFKGSVVAAVLCGSNENGTATLANGKIVSVNAAGVMAARMSSDKGFVASR